MAFNVKITDKFAESYIAASEYLTRCDESGRAASRLVDEVEGTMHLLAEFPRMYAVREDESRKSGIEVRAVSVGRYLLFYQVLEDVVYLHTLRHKLADPDAIDWSAITGD